VQFGSSHVLDPSEFGQFAITLSTTLGSPFDSWRLLTVDSGIGDADSCCPGGPYITIGFIDNQEPYRSAGASSASLQLAFANAISNPNDPLNAKLHTLDGDFAIDFSAPEPQQNIEIDISQVTPCNNGLWYLKGSIPNAVDRQCGNIPDATASASSTNKVAVADALVGIFVGGALAMIVAAFIYYKWIAKSHPDTSGKTGMGMELNTVEATAPVVAVPASQLSAPETNTTAEKSL